MVSVRSRYFVARRIVNALALRDPHAPARGGGVALLAGVMVAALGLAGAAAYGVLRPGVSDSWRDGNSVVIEEETGSRFVYLDGVLHPVVNYSSALLILGTAHPRRALVPRAALSDVPRGAPLGIPGAPDLLPAAQELVSGPWVLCSRPTGAERTPESVLYVGSTPTGDLADLGERAILALDESNGLHLVWRGRRHPLRDPDVVLAAFAWSRQAAVPLDTALLNALPVGADIGRLSVARRGERSIVDGLRVGQVFVVESQSGDRHYGVVLHDGLADLTPVQAGILLADGANGLEGRAIPMSSARYAASPRAASLVPSGDGAPPAVTPDLAEVQASTGVCASFHDGKPTPVVSLVTTVDTAMAELDVGASDVAVVVDRIAVHPGRGALVEALPAPNAPSGTLALISDLGLRFSVPSADVLATLGYPPEVARPQRLPAALVSLVPAGRALDPAAAVRPALM